jgi:hypothetical protein
MKGMLHARKAYVLRVLVPLILGGMIYGFFRDPHLLALELIDDNALSSFIRDLQQASMPIVEVLPYWFSQSVPDALWCYACMSFILILWRESPPLYKHFWLCIAVILALGFEAGQFLKVVPGTFCVNDLLFSVVAILIALFSEVISKVEPQQRYTAEAQGPQRGPSFVASDTLR